MIILINDQGLTPFSCYATHIFMGVPLSCPSLIDMIEESDRLIIVDAIVTGSPPGTIHELSLEDILSVVPIHLASSHDIDFLTIFGLGEEILGKRLPSEVLIIAVEAADVTNFSEECTPHVKEAINKVVRLVKSKLTA